MDKAHDDRLKQVFVTSLDKEVSDLYYGAYPYPCVHFVIYLFQPVYEPSRTTLDKPLPVNRQTEYFEMGFKEPDPANISTGKISLRQGLEIVSKFKTSTENYTVEKLSEEYKLTNEVTRECIHSI